MESFDIIIPSWNQTELVCACLQSIRLWSKDYMLIFVDNGSEPSSLESILVELDKHPHRLIRNYRNLGFVKAVNQGLSISTAPYTVLLNNDTRVTESWLDKLYLPFTENHKIAAVGPITDTEECWQGRHPAREGWMLCSQTTMLAFFCVMLKKSAVAKIGLLDERFGAGLGDDDDYCRRLHLAGYRLALAENCLVHHAHRSTFNKLYSAKEVERMTEKGLDLFRRKHRIKK